MTKLTDFLNPEALLLEPPAADKWALIRSLSQCLASAHGAAALDADEIEAAVRSREEQVTTGLEAGLALPHGMIPSLDNTFGAFAWLANGLDFESFDGEPARCILMMVFPDTEEGRSRHLELLGTAIQVLGAEGFLARTQDITSTSRVWDVLVEVERQLGF